MTKSIRNTALLTFAALACIGTALAQGAFNPGQTVTHKGRPAMVTGKSTAATGTRYRLRYSDTKTDACKAGEYCVPEAELKAASAPVATTPTMPATFTPVAKTSQAWLDAHNKHRRAVKSPDIQWSETLAQKAQSYANLMAAKGPASGCTYNHNLYGYSLDMSTFGENIGAALAPSPGKDKSADEVVQSFADEKPNFDPATSRCKPGTVCQHYTQVVSQLSTAVGCGQAACNAGGYTTVMYVCNYTAPGNQMTPNGYKNLYPGQR